VKVRLFYEAPDDGGGSPPADAPPAEQWQPTEEWGSRIDRFIESAQPVLGQLGEVLADPGQQQDPYYDPNAYDPNAYDPNFQPGFEQGQPQLDPMVAQLVEQAVGARLGAFEPMLAQIAEREGREIAVTELTKMQTELGAFDVDKAVVVTQSYMAQGMPPQEALRQAAQYVRQDETSVESRIEEAVKQALDEFKQQLGHAASAPETLGAPGAAIGVPTTPTGRDRYETVLQNFESAVNPVDPTQL